MCSVTLHSVRVTTLAAALFGLAIPAHAQQRTTVPDSANPTLHAFVSKAGSADASQANPSVTAERGVAVPASTATPLSFDQAFEHLQPRGDRVDRVLSDGSVLSISVDSALAGADAWHANQARMQNLRLSAFSVVSRQANGVEFAAGVGGSASNYFGIGDFYATSEHSMLLAPVFSNPYLTLMPDASHAAIGGNLGNGVKLKFGVLTSGFDQGRTMQDGFPVAANYAALPKTNSAVIELSTSSDAGGLSVAFLRTNELTGYPGAPLIASVNAPTSSVQVAAALKLMPKWTLAGQLAYSETPSDATRLLDDGTPTRTSAFSVGVVTADRLKSGDRFSIALSQPIRTYTGKSVADLLSFNTSSGARGSDNLRFSMVPIGRELRAELNYQRPMGKGASGGVVLMVRRNPDYVDRPMESVLAVRYQKQF